MEGNKVRVKEYDDGIFIDLGGSPHHAEYYDAQVQIWRDENGNIVAIDIVFDKSSSYSSPVK